MTNRAVAWRALRAGLLAGLATGACDAAWSWGDLARFVPGVAGRFAVVVHAACLYGLAAAVVVPVVALTGLAILRGTRLGGTAGLALERHLARRLEDPRKALAPVSLAVSGTALAAAALAGAYAIGLNTIMTRNHRGLVVAVVIAATVGLLLAAALAAFALGRLLEALLAALVRGRLLSALTHPAAVPVAVAILLAAFGCATAALAWETLAQLPLRPLVASGATAILAAAFALLLGKLDGRPPRLPRVAGFILAPAALAALFGLALATGSSAPVRKAARASTGLCGPLLGPLRARFLGTALGSLGLRRGAEPLARRSADDARFVPVPADVPEDVNVLLVITDTVRADHVGAYGYSRPTTPAIDALAREGALFENAWAHAPSTRYSIPAIMTGRYPSQVLWDKSVWWPALRPENHMLAEMMKENGLTTAAILNYHYFDRIRRLDQGFDHYDNTNARLHRGRDPASTRGTSSREQADAAIAWLEANAGTRFFAWVHFYDPHAGFEEHLGTRTFGTARVDMYDHEILFTDEQIARVFAKMKDLGIYDKTVIVVVGDHGEGFGEHGIEAHGYHLYAPQTKVPLVIRVPGLAPRRILTPAGHVDLVPTLVNLVGGEPEATMFGRSLVPELAGTAPADGDRNVFQEVVYEGPTERRAVVNRRWHLIYNMVPDDTFELYDLSVDPGENRDVWGTADPGRLKDELLAWIAATRVRAGTRFRRPANSGIVRP
ncbi:MAG: sulfatase [Deltaproteobacteria bacterium]|nr:sulfatase [Deltaproteobacteria bacterium]